MLADDEVLLDELDIDTQRMLEAAERPALAGIDPNATQVPTQYDITVCAPPSISALQSL